MRAMILCAGLGTRLRPYTDTLAKPAIPFLNVPLLGYSLFHLESLGLTDLVANTHHLPKTVEDAAKRIAGKYNLHFSLEQPILSSGGGIWRAEKQLRSEDDFFVSNGDEVIFFREPDGFERMLEQHQKTGALVTLLTTMHADVGVKFNGIRTDLKGRVTGLSVPEAGTEHFTGVFIFSPRIWDFMKDAHAKCGDVFHIFKDVLTPAMEKGEKVMTFREKDLLWLETSDPKSYAESSRRALEWFASGDEYGREIRAILKRYGTKYKAADKEQRIWLGRGAEFKGKLADEAFVLLGDKAKVGPEVEVSGFAVLGEGTTFKNGVLQNAVIGNNVNVHEMVALKNQLLL